MIGFLIGRFQPFHLGHLEAIKFALSKVEHLHVGIGSSNKSHEKRNPFTADERKKMILSSIDDKLKKNLSVHYIPDVDDHSKWTHLVDELIPEYDVVFLISGFLSYIVTSMLYFLASKILNKGPVRPEPTIVAFLIIN